MINIVDINVMQVVHYVDGDTVEDGLVVEIVKEPNRGYVGLRKDGNTRRFYTVDNSELPLYSTRREALGYLLTDIDKRIDAIFDLKRKIHEEYIC